MFFRTRPSCRAYRECRHALNIVNTSCSITGLHHSSPNTGSFTVHVPTAHWDSSGAGRKSCMVGPHRVIMVRVSDHQSTLQVQLSLL